ncbi:HAD hydrolase family protein [Synechococcus sp. CBW1002]|uniref:HAD family hydrolase n=1 Tax=Synechococcus sp. CBW1002 TaxID=1353134 RepID=UPI0018CCFB18|nr:HAD family hydrolase [Synechococcus sp. CBW1002]QPN60848.1 HAD hydrolase family protein [Synechococcus sp. CBW1002]
MAADPPARLLLCTDLDRTLIPNGRQPESPAARSLFARLVQRPEVTLAYVSGRDAALVAEAIVDYALPSPDWVVADVGTTLLEVAPDGWRAHRGWHQSIGVDWAGRTAQDLHQLLADLSPLDLQEPAKQNTYKLSYYLHLDVDVPSLCAEIERRLELEQLRASLITSMDEQAEIGLLDVLPPAATKLHAVRFLMELLGFDSSETLFCGDSGNDLPVMTSDLPSVLVANADPALMAQLGCSAGERSPRETLYLAQGGFMGMNGNYAAGIVEGVLHFHPQLSGWLAEPC